MSLFKVSQVRSGELTYGVEGSLTIFKNDHENENLSEKINFIKTGGKFFIYEGKMLPN